MPLLSQLTGSGSGGTPVGSLVLFPAGMDNVVQTGGESYLKTGVVAPATQFPTTPTQFKRKLYPLTEYSSIGTGFYADRLIVDENGKIYSIVDGGVTGNNGYTFNGTSDTISTDMVANNWSTGIATGSYFSHFVYNNKLYILVKVNYWGGNPHFAILPDNTHSEIAYSGAFTSNVAVDGAKTYIIGCDTTTVKGYTFAGSWGDQTLTGLPTNYGVNSVATSCDNNSGVMHYAMIDIPNDSVANYVIYKINPKTSQASALSAGTYYKKIKGCKGLSSTNYPDGLLLALTNSFQPAQSITPSGAIKNFLLPSESADWVDIAFSEKLGKIVVIKTNSNEAAIGNNTANATFASVTLPKTAKWDQIEWSSHLEAFFLHSSTEGLLYVSYDGVNWKQKSTPSIVYSKFVNDGAKKALFRNQFLGNKNNNFWATSSDNGANWVCSKIMLPSISTSTGEHTYFGYANGVHFCYSRETDGNTRIKTTTTPSNPVSWGAIAAYTTVVDYFDANSTRWWTPGNSPVSVEWDQVGNKFYIFRKDCSIMTTPNAINTAPTTISNSAFTGSSSAITIHGHQAEGSLKTNTHILFFTQCYSYVELYSANLKTMNFRIFSLPLGGSSFTQKYESNLTPISALDWHLQYYGFQSKFFNPSQNFLCLGYLHSGNNEPYGNQAVNQFYSVTGDGSITTTLPFPLQKYLSIPYGDESFYTNLSTQYILNAYDGSTKNSFTFSPPSSVLSTTYSYNASVPVYFNNGTDNLVIGSNSKIYKIDTQDYVGVPVSASAPTNSAYYTRVS